MHQLTSVKEIQSDNYRTKTFVLDCAIDAYPGQFVMVWLPGFDEKPFSIVGSDPLTVMVTAVGPFTELVQACKPGDPFWVRGPFGHGYRVNDDVRHALLVGGGYGVAPLLYLARQLLHTNCRITVALGARSERELLYVDRFRGLKDGSGESVEVLLATDDGSLGHRGFVTEPADAALQNDVLDCVYACGPDVMLEAVKRLAMHHGVSCQLSWEAYMRCGMGLCGSCEHEQKLLCMDGPVLSYSA